MNKSPDAFRTISEVGDDLDIPQHVLRFWETRFPSIRPLKRGGGRRYYRPEDVDLLKGIRLLLYGQGYTIKGVQRILKEAGPRHVQGIGRGEAVPLPAPGEGPAGWPEDGEVVAVPADRSQPERDGLAHERATREPGAADLSPGDLDRLRSALDELFECRRLLAGLRSG